jgi:hypothetical protein
LRHRTGIDDDGHEVPARVFVTSPNMLTIPDFGRDRYPIQVRADGRFATADFTLFPQWYAEGTKYLPYVRKKPILAADLEKTYIWHNISEKDFIREEGSVAGGMGRLSTPIAESFAEMTFELMSRIRNGELSSKFPAEDLRDLYFCMRGMHFASIGLLHGPQNYQGILLTVTHFQRYYLETLACYEYLTRWRDMPPNTSSQARKVQHVMGALTPDVEVAIDLFDKGVPVWLVRHASMFPLSTILINEVSPTLDPMELDLLPGSAVIWAGDAGAFRNRVCQSLRMASINLGHSAYQATPGRFVTVANQG